MAVVYVVNTSGARRAYVVHVDHLIRPARMATSAKGLGLDVIDTPPLYFTSAAGGII